MVFRALLLTFSAAAVASPFNFTQYLLHNDPLKSFQGYTLIAPADIPGYPIFLMDNDGVVVHQWTGREEWLCTPGYHLQKDGMLLLSTCPSHDGYNGGLVRLDWDGNVVWSFEDEHLHHDALPLPNGNVLTSYFEYKTPDDAMAAGVTKGMLQEYWIDGPHAEEPNILWSDGLAEVKQTGPDTGEIVWKWLFWDHLVQNTNSSLPNYGEPSERPERYDINAWSFPANMSRGRFCHLNAVDYNEELDQIVLSCRNFNEVFIVDHSTSVEEAASSTGGRSGKGGDFLYRWGHPANYGVGVEKTWDEQGLNGAHDVHWLSSDVPGRSDGILESNALMIFNNINTSLGISPPDERSTVDVLQLPAPDPATGIYPTPQGGSYLPETPSWAWGIGGMNANHISGAQRVGNGNTIVTDGEMARIREVTNDGEVVWDWAWGGSPCQKPYTDMPSYNTAGYCLFRTYRYPSTYPGLAGRNLSSDCGGQSIQMI